MGSVGDWLVWHLYTRVLIVLGEDKDKLSLHDWLVWGILYVPYLRLGCALQRQELA